MRADAFRTVGAGKYLASEGFLGEGVVNLIDKGFHFIGGHQGELPLPGNRRSDDLDSSRDDFGDSLGAKFFRHIFSFKNVMFSGRNSAEDLTLPAFCHFPNIRPLFMDTSLSGVASQKNHNRKGGLRE